MPSPTNSRKRKAEVLEAADTSEPKPGAAVSSSHLPATCLAAVLNFLPYSDVRRCMLAGKTMAVEAASQVETLNIMNPSELVGPAARRFANVSDLNILCLTSLGEPDNVGRNQILSATTAARTTPFMTIFPKLKSALIGGVRRQLDGSISYWNPYLWYDCRGRDHTTVFQVLAESLCGAFQAKMLSADLVIEGLQFGTQLNCKCQHSPSLREEESGIHCHFCRNIIASFPVRDVVLGISRHSFCPSIVACLDAFLKRSDSAPALQSDEGKEMIVQLLQRHLKTHQMSQTQHPEFSRRMMKKGAKYLAWGEYHLVHYLSPYWIPVIRDIVQMVSVEIVRLIPNAFLSGSIFESNEGKIIVLQETVDTLIGFGFNLNPKDYVFVDVHKEPALVLLKSNLEKEAEMRRQLDDESRG